MPVTEYAEITKRHPKNHRENGIFQEVKSFLPKRRQELLKWNGWGYKDSKFVFNTDTNQFSFSGNRYSISNQILPGLKPWVESEFGIDFETDLDKQITGNKKCSDTFLTNCTSQYRDFVQKNLFKFREKIEVEDVPAPVINEKFFQRIKEQEFDFSLELQDRLFRSHGHTIREIFELRIGNLKRIPDIIIWPRCHDDVVKIVQLAVDHEVVIIPFGGGTSVSCGVECPANERRMIVSLDTSQMNKILWVNKTNNTALIEAGIIGQDLDYELEKHGLCIGHEPDSREFSTLGGWIATRSSGMKKNVYGNIEDMVVHVKMVTPKGVMQRNCQVPRISGGPDIHQIVLGSEGILGVITEVIMRVYPIPAYKKYGSIVFPKFELGVDCLKEVVGQQLRPASMRLMDNAEFTFGHALKPEATSFISSLADRAAKYYVTQVKKFDIKKICAVTLLLEGTKKVNVDTCHKHSPEIINIHQPEKLTFTGEYRHLPDIGLSQGLPAGEENGKRGYMLTFVIAYLRDLALDFGAVSESFETSVPWDKVIDLCKNVKDRIEREVSRYAIPSPPFVSCRVTQSYDVGACVYFYFAFHCLGVPDAVTIYEDIEIAARDEVLANGGSISHHHGVGKLRKPWMKQTISDTGLEMLRAVKSSVDPLNIFASGNLLDSIKIQSSL